MAAVYSSVNDQGTYREYVGNNGTGADDILIETTDVSKFKTFQLSHGAGAVYVRVHDGQRWLTASRSLTDLGAASLTPVLVTVALREYGFRGHYKAIRVQQSGATVVTAPVLRCS